MYYVNSIELYLKHFLTNLLEDTKKEIDGKINQQNFLFLELHKVKIVLLILT